MTHTTTLSALHAAMRHQPDEDVPRLLYAEALDELPTKWVTCPRCKGECGESTPDYDGGLCDRFWDQCPTCSGTGSVADAGDAERAEFIRLQVELAAWRAADFEGKSRYDGERMIHLSAREDELLERHAAAWSKFTCPECGNLSATARDLRGKCSTCGNPHGDLFHGLTVSFSRGFPHRLTAPKLDSWVALETLGGGPTRVGMGYRPTPMLLACLRHMTAREFAAKDKEPYVWQGRHYWSRESWGLGRDSLPDPIFFALEIGTSGNTDSMRGYDSLSAAHTALAVAVGRFGE